MSDWRYLATRLKGDGTETVIHSELPLSNVEITHNLSGPDGMSATITPEIVSLVGADGEPVFDPWSTALYAEKDGEIRCGVILDEMLVKGGSAIDLHGIGFPGYLKDMPYNGDYAGVNVDPLDIFRMIWQWVQAQHNGDLGVFIDPTISSLVRVGTAPRDVEFTTGTGEQVAFEAGPFKLNWYSTHDLAGVVSKLVQETPFDFHERHYWQGETIKHVIEIGRGRLLQIGRRRDDLRFVAGENIAVIPDTLFPGEAYASEVWVLGAGEGAKTIKSVVARPDETRLRRVAVVDEKDADSVRKANTAATAELKMRYGRPEIDEIKVFDHPHAPLGSFGVGDEIFIQNPEGWQGDLGLWARIISYTITPDEPTVASVQVLRVDRI